MTLWSLFCRASGLTGLFPRSALFHSEAYGGWARDSVREVDIVTGCLLLIARTTWDRLGGFDRAFTMYGEEADLCLRARALGARPMITPEATIIHYGGASETVRADKMVRLLRAKRELVTRHFGPLSRPLAAGLLMLWPLGRAVLLGVAARLTRNPACVRAPKGGARSIAAGRNGRAAFQASEGRGHDLRRGCGASGACQVLPVRPLLRAGLLKARRSGPV